MSDPALLNAVERQRRFDALPDRKGAQNFFSEKSV
jgi:hypothetical protein